MYGWSLGGVNNVLIFELNPRDRLTFWHMATLATSFGVIWFLNLIIFLLLSSKLLFDFRLSFTYLVPILLNSLLLIFFVVRIDPFHLKSTKRWLQNVVIKEIKAGFVPVAFVDFWFADQLNSLGLVFLDFEFFFCFFIKEQQLEYNPTSLLEQTNDVIVAGNVTNTTLIDENEYRCGSFDYGIRYFVAIYPAYIRFAQCIRRMNDSPQKKKMHHLANALKYSTTFVKVLFAAIYSRYKSTGMTHRL